MAAEARAYRSGRHRRPVTFVCRDRLKSFACMFDRRLSRIASLNFDYAELLDMTLMRVRRAAQLTLPADVLRALNLREGDFLDAEIVKDGVLLKPVDAGDRQRAWKRIESATAAVVDREPDATESMQAAEEAIAESVRAFRRANA